MESVIHNVPAMLALTLGAYLLGVWVKKKSGLSLLHPFLICIPVIAAVLKFTGTPVEFYIDSNKMVDFLLGPSVVSLGLLMYDHLETIRKHLLSITVSVFTGSLVGVGSVYFLCRFFRLDELFIKSMEAKSVTTPIAMDITASLGGNVSLAAVTVILCGFIGTVFGPMMIRMFHIDTSVAKGLALGCCSHGLGTSKAIELGAVEGAVSGLAIAMMGIMTAIVVPLFNMIFPI